jgi:hypothetical protein
MLRPTRYPRRIKCVCAHSGTTSLDAFQLFLISAYDFVHFDRVRAAIGRYAFRSELVNVFIVLGGWRSGMQTEETT